MSRIVIVGGYGAFGAHAVERLAAEPSFQIVIAGRSEHKAAAHADRVRPTAQADIACAKIDATTATSREIEALDADVLINASGPFQDQRYELARACIASRCHYIDLADARAFVSEIEQLDTEARAAGVCVISGASSVPGLSSAVVREYADAFASLDEIEIGISPGNSFDPGAATVASILGSLGEPFTRRGNGGEETAHGWQGLHRHDFPGLGSRLMCDVDVPDLDLLPAHYPQLRSARFFAGLEVSVFHLGLWGLSWLVRAGLVRNPASLTPALLRAKRTMGFLGSDKGAMYVAMRGTDEHGVRKSIDWTLVARSGHGPYVPAIASVVLAKQLAADAGPQPGAQPCFGLFPLAAFRAETEGLDISTTTLMQ